MNEKINKRTELALAISAALLTALSIVATVIFSLKILYVPLVIAVILSTAGLILTPILFNKTKN